MRIAKELKGDRKDQTKQLKKYIHEMMSLDQKQQPYIVVWDMETQRFIQYAGSKGEKLLLDVPRYKFSQRFDNDEIDTAMHTGWNMFDSMMFREIEKRRTWLRLEFQ